MGVEENIRLTLEILQPLPDILDVVVIHKGLEAPCYIAEIVRGAKGHTVELWELRDVETSFICVEYCCLAACGLKPLSNGLSHLLGVPKLLGVIQNQRLYHKPTYLHIIARIIISYYG